MKIACDFDSTLFPFIPNLKWVACKEGIRIPLKPNNWFFNDNLKDKHGEELTFQDFSNLVRKAHSPNILKKEKPYGNSQKVLSEFKNKGHEVIYISDNHAQSYGSIYGWLQEHKFLDSENDFVITQDKRVWLKENKPDIVIDDRVRTLLYARYELGILAIGLEYSINVNLKKEVEGVYICEDWLTIGEVLDSIIERKG